MFFGDLFVIFRGFRDFCTGWAAGGLFVNPGMEGRFWHTTDGGRTWALDGVVDGTVATSLEVAGPDRAYAGCITRLQVSTLCYLA